MFFRNFSFLVPISRGLNARFLSADAHGKKVQGLGQFPPVSMSKIPNFKANTGAVSILDLIPAFEQSFYQFAHSATTFPSF